MGKHKALVFDSALGITSRDYLKLKRAILEGLATGNCYESFSNFHGKLYVVDIEMINFAKKATVRTSWIIKNGEDFPRLTSCYVKT